MKLFGHLDIRGCEEPAHKEVYLRCIRKLFEDGGVDRCRTKVWQLGGMSDTSYVTTNILTTVPRGLSRVSCIVPADGTVYPFLPKRISP